MDHFGNLEVDLLIDIPGFIAIDLKHQWPITNPIVSLLELLEREDVKAGIFLIDRRQILRTQQNSRIVIDRTSESLDPQ